VPSPVLYFACHHLEVAGGVEVTGSHNRTADNGLKILRGTQSLWGPEIADLRRRVEAGIEPAGRRGQVSERDVNAAYLERAVSSLELGDRRPAVVVDGGNGAAGPTAAALYRAIGCEVTELYTEMDGRFPNHHPDPTVAANLADLADRVIAEGAELGIGLDGDGDRLGVVDGRGRIIAGDQLMLLLGREILREVPGATVIGEVKCSQTMYDGLAAAGGVAIMWKVGHSLIKAKMAETGAALAGEMSGHLFFAHRWLGFDDGAYAGARLIEMLSRSDRTLAEHYETLPPAVNTPEIRVGCPDDRKLAVVERAAALLASRADVAEVVDIDGARARFDGGWGLIRASNTEAALVIRCEADTAERLAEIRAAIDEVIAEAG
jgi:phosphomannomutase/phosphoglucomutase